MKRELQLTADGSHTLFIPELGEHYHSVNGAIQESVHVFINAGFSIIPQKKVRILEIGFGTGLNAFLTLLESRKEESKKEIEYFTIEKYPLESSLTESLNYASLLKEKEKSIFHSLHSVPWNKPAVITSEFILTKMEGDSNTIALPSAIDLVYFDAFAPDKQPEMWNQEIFCNLYNHMSENGVITTYCAKGSVRRMMKEAGFQVERLPGPPGKREMLRGQKIKTQDN